MGSIGIDFPCATPCPSSTGMPRARQLSRNSAHRRDLPVPASATTPTTCPLPPRARSSAASSTAMSRSRPTKRDRPRARARSRRVRNDPTPSRSKSADRLAHALDLGASQVLQPEVALDEPRRVLGETDVPRFGQRLHALRQADRVPLRRVVHAQIVADPADHDLARVEADAHPERDAVPHAHLVGIFAHGVAQVQRRVAGALRVVLVRDRRAEERHDAVAGVLVHRALEAMDAVGEDREEAVEDLVPLFGIELLGQIHRALHVGEEHGHLLALAFEGGLRRCRIFSARCFGV